MAETGFQLTRDEATAVLPKLQAHAAALLERSGIADAAALAARLRAGTAGGDAIETLNQNTDDDRWPAELDSLWRVLVAFEQAALGGELVVLQDGGTAVSVMETTPETRAMTSGEALWELDRPIEDFPNRKPWAALGEDEQARYEARANGLLQTARLIGEMTEPPVPQPHPWMLHAAAHALFHEGEALTELAERFRAVEIPARHAA